MCKVSVPNNNFKRSTAASHRFFNTSADQKSTTISLGAEPAASRFAPQKPATSINKRPPAGVGKRTAIDQKGTNILLGTEKSSARFAAPPKPKSVEARAAGSTKKMKKPAHFIDSPAAGLSLGTEKASARFVRTQQTKKPVNSFDAKNIAAGSAKASGRTRQSDSAVALGTDPNAHARFAHKEAGRAPAPAKKPTAAAGAPTEYGTSKCDAKPSIRVTRDITASTYAFSGGAADAPLRRERKTHTSSMSFQGGAFAGDEANSAKQRRSRSCTANGDAGKGHQSSIAFSGGVTSTEQGAAARRAQRQRPVHAAQHASSIAFRSNGMGGAEPAGAGGVAPRPRRREEHNSTLSLGSDTVRYASTSIASKPARRGQPLRNHIPAGGRAKSAPVAITDKISAAPAPARTNRCPQNYGRSQVFF